MATNMVSTVAALSIGEILSLVLSFCNDSATLAACLRVNKFWAEEAILYLWENCGAEYLLNMRCVNHSPLAFTPPSIDALSCLAKWPRRMQRYVSCIRTLCFDILIEEPEKTHSSFQHIKFSRLRRLTIAHFSSSPEIMQQYNYGTSLLPYLQPQLKYIRLHGSPLSLSEIFYTQATICCPGLLGLSLWYLQDASHKVSVQVLAEFLGAVKYLSALSFNNQLSVEILRLLANHKNLKQLAIPYVPSEWIEEIAPAIPAFGNKLFPSLEKLHVSIFDEGLELLVPLVQHISELTLKVCGESTRALRIAAGIPGLVALDLEFDSKSAVRASDLLLIADKCFNITTIRITANNTHHISGDNISDATIDCLARRLPRLEELVLLIWDHEFGVRSLMTEAALVSLAVHCRRLRMLQTAAYVSIDHFPSIDETIMFPSLRLISLDAGKDDPRWDNSEDINDFATRFAAQAPRLLYCSGNRPFIKAIQAIIGARVQPGG